MDLAITDASAAGPKLSCEYWDSKEIAQHLCTRCLSQQSGATWVAVHRGRYQDPYHL
jgi:hypothetical protein